jgi:CDP-2,3-bis-(O-geranylgeranyl)-sn-glycerol synthase
MSLQDALIILLLLLAANGSPVLAARLLGSRWQQAVDFGVRFFDRQPLLGSSKTWRGLVAALLLTALTALLLGQSWLMGLMVAVYAMLGDLLASFIKRRLKLPASSKATGLDQMPEALLPLLYLRTIYELGAGEILILIAAFFALNKAFSILLYYLKIRLRPY